MNNPGEIGGIIAGVVALLAALGAGLKWLFDFTAGRNDKNEASRTAKLQTWHDELDEREREFDEKQRAYQAQIEARLSQVEVTNRTLLRAVEMLSASLRVIEPNSPILAQVALLLEQAFPVDHNIPPEMRAGLAAIRESRPKRRANGGAANGKL